MAKLSLRTSELVQIILCILTQVPPYFEKCGGSSWFTMDQEWSHNINIDLQMKFLTFALQLIAALSWIVSAFLSGIRIVQGVHFIGYAITFFYTFVIYAWTK